MLEVAAGGGGRTTALLALGAALGIGLAVASLTQTRGGARALPEGAVAAVNGVHIRRVDYERAVAALTSDRRSPLTAEDRRHVLDRLIDEELLVQYGIELGLVRSDRRVRGDLVSAVLAAQVAAVDGFEPSADEVRDFYERNAEFFALPGRFRVAVLWFRIAPGGSHEEALQRAGEAVAALRAGEAAAAVGARLADAPVAPLPDGYLPAAKIREYLGPTATKAALALEAGQVSEPLRTNNGAYVLQMVDRESSSSPPLAEVEEQVRAEMRRRAGDDAVRGALESLRAQGEVVVRGDQP